MNMHANSQRSDVRLDVRSSYSRSTKRNLGITLQENDKIFLWVYPMKPASSWQKFAEHLDDLERVGKSLAERSRWDCVHVHGSIPFFKYQMNRVQSAISISWCTILRHNSSSTFGSICLTARASLKDSSILPSFSNAWHLLNRAFVSWGRISRAGNTVNKCKCYSLASASHKTSSLSTINADVM